MKRTQKSSSQKQAWQANRQRYTWHLRPPFSHEFDSVHWWKGRSNVEPVAALYELARRHPLVHEGWLKKITQPGNHSLPAPSLHWTCLLGLKSWAGLEWTDRKNWESVVGLLKGLDFRHSGLQCRSIKLFAHWKIIDHRKQLLRKKAETQDSLSKLVRANLAKNPPTADEWEAAIAQTAVEAHRQGYVLLAVAPDLTMDKAKSVMAKKYSLYLRVYPPAARLQRERSEDWLALISAFEDAERLLGGAKSQVFARYRRTVDGILFT